MRKVTVLPNQNVFDIALQEYGAAEGAYWLAKDNKLEGWQVSEGTELLVRDEALNPRIVNYWKAIGYKPATGGCTNKGPDFNLDFNLDFNA